MGRVQAFCQGEELFVQDCYVGADPDYKMPIRIITEKAWHSLFARNMFITTEDRDELKKFFLILLLSFTDFKVEPTIDGTRSETGIILNLQNVLQ